MIDPIKNNYGEAIRSHTDVTSMQKAIKAVFNHIIKDTPVQQLMFCPTTSDTWCKFWQNKLHDTGLYEESTRLPIVFKE